MKANIPKNVTGHHFGSRCSKHAIRHHSLRRHTPPPTNLPCPCPGSCPRCLPVATGGDVPSIQMESLTVYAERPSETSEYGHAFFTISDDEEESLTRGFYASCWLEGSYSLSDEIGMITIGVPGTVRDDTDHISRADESRHYTINSGQYGSARSYIESWESETPRYHLLTNNCADFACGAAEAAGITVPTTFLSTILITEPQDIADGIANERLLQRQAEAWNRYTMWASRNREQIPAEWVLLGRPGLM